MNRKRRMIIGTAIASATLPQLLRTTSAWAQAPVKLNVGVLRNVPGSLIVVANDKNLFERKGPFELVLPGKFLSGGGPELLPAVAAGNLDLGVIGDTPVILALGRGELPLEIVSVVSDTSAVFSIVAGGEINSVTDLAGKRIGLPQGTAFEYFLARALEKFGMKQSDVQVVNLTQAQAQPAFVAKRIDAALPDTFGRSALMAARPDAKVLFNSETGFTTGSGSLKAFRQYNVFIAKTGTAATKRDALRGFLRAYYQDAVPYLMSPATQGEAITHMANYLNAAVKGALSEDDMKKQVALSGFPNLERAKVIQKDELRSALETQAEFWVQSKRIPAKPDFGKLLDTALLA